MDFFAQGMKGPSRPAPSIPGLAPNVTRYSPVTNWNDDPFGADVFEPKPQFMQKKKPPPRPPPPRVNSKPPDVPHKPSHFIRRPTVLTSLLSRKNKSTTHPAPNTNVNLLANSRTLVTEYNNNLDPNKMFPKCEPKNVQTGALIDLSSPPSSPTFTTRSSSDGLSVDSFGSDATTSTNHHNVMSGGSASQAESGFEDDFDLFLHSRKTITKDDTMDDFTTIDPFSPQPQMVQKPPILKKPILSRDLFELSNSNQLVSSSKGPTIIRVKPARPKPPDNSAILKNTFRNELGGTFPMTAMSVNTTATPIQRVTNGSAENFDWKSSTWDDEGSLDREEGSPEREWSPPMPSVPPPPPPELGDDVLAADWPVNSEPIIDEEEPSAEALFDYFTDHPEDLCFSAGSKIKLIRRVDNEWLYGRMRSGIEGVFPANYVEIKVPLPNEMVPRPASVGSATALYDFEPVQPGDLSFLTGDTITLMYKINDEWYFGECHGKKGQFPVNYVQMS